MYSDVVAALKEMVGENVNNIHTALPGEITKVNTSTGRVTVQPKAVMTVGGEQKEFPKISNVPIAFPYSANGTASIAFPVNVGDQCLLIFSEQSTDYWLDNGTIADGLKFDLSNAICIPGLMKTVSEDFANAVNLDSVIIRNGSSRIALSKSAITIRGDVTVLGNLTYSGDLKQS